MIKYSFIIPVKEINDYIRESVPRILDIKRDDYEIIIYPDDLSAEHWNKTKQIRTGHVGPAEKRSLAMKDALGDILVFIDDDAYPESNFLEILDNDFKDNSIQAIGGPAITPKDDNFWQKVSGAVFLSFLSGGNPDRYISSGKKKNVDDWPSVNFSLRKEVFIELNGFDSAYWPGEDTKLCLELLKKYPNGIMYDPELIAYHHRRSGLLKHLKQVSGYGTHRGFFAKKYPENSFKLKYFIPSGFLLFLVFGVLLAFSSIFFLKLYLIIIFIYILVLMKVGFDIYKYEKDLWIVLNALYYIFLTHVVYGYNFIKGFVFVKNLKSKLR